MDGTRLMGRWGDLTGKPHPLSTADHILQYGEEFRGSLGHISMIGIGKYILPFTGGNGNTVYAQPELDGKYIDAARAQGGIAGFVHPYNSASRQPSGYAGTLIAVDAALGKGDFYDIGALVSDEIASAEFYYRLLNCGFRIAATSGTDNFSDVWRDPPPGADRAYVKIRGPLSLRAWMDGVKAGRTFGTTGPLLFLEVEGKEPGDEIALSDSAPASLRVKADASSIAPLEKLEVVVNGKVAQTVKVTGNGRPPRLPGRSIAAAGRWVAARVVGPPSRPSATVTRSRRRARSTSSAADGGLRWRKMPLLRDVVDAIRARADGGGRGRGGVPARQRRPRAKALPAAGGHPRARSSSPR